MSRQLEISWKRGLLRCLDIQSNKTLMRRSFLKLKVLWKKFTALKLGKHSANYSSIPTPSFKYKYLIKWKHRQQCIKSGALVEVRQCAIAPVRPCARAPVRTFKCQRFRKEKKMNKENKAEERGKQNEMKCFSGFCLTCKCKRQTWSLHEVVSGDCILARTRDVCHGVSLRLAFPRY